jgi:TetR/AcrR family transcriptional regulator, regulator of cefoperazone and chloramphenicol sensitivity
MEATKTISEATAGHEDAHLRTRRRLLEAAGQVFAEVGFRDATVREICRRAEANVAAVNYHFGDKARLYSETLRDLANESMRKFPLDLGLPETAPAEQRLRAFAQSFLHRFFSYERAALYGRIIAREMIEPTHALPERINETMRPMANLVAGIVRQVLGPDAPADEVRRCACSVVGQVVFYKHCQPIFRDLFPGEDFGPEGIAALADHIASFSMAALTARAKQLARNKKETAKK